jgi:hypothetical protein
MELISRNLVGDSVFDTARNVYSLIMLSKELNKAPEELADCIHQAKNMQIDKIFVKHLFEAFVDCSSVEEQSDLISLILHHFNQTGDNFSALSNALNDLELWHIRDMK